MAPKPKVMIIAASIGGGHIQAGRAVQTALSMTHPDVETVFVDFSAPRTSSLSRLVKNAYLFTLEAFPGIYDFLYHLSQRPFWGSLICRLTGLAMKSPLMSLVRDHQPDMIVCTHPFPCAGAAELRRSGLLKTPVAAVITDFVVHRLWVYADIDKYFVAAVPLQTSLEKLDIPPERIQVTGIPIRPFFSGDLTRSSSCSRLGLTPELPTLLLMGGSLGLDTMLATLRQLDHLTFPLNIIAVAGANEGLRQKLEKMAEHSPHQVKVFGYTQEIPLFMSAADLLITKPGALTISEALATGLPLLLYQALPGQEEDNAAYLTDQHAALRVNDEAELPQLLRRLLPFSVELSSLGKRARELGRPDAAHHIAETVYEILRSTKLPPDS